MHPLIFVIHVQLPENLNTMRSPPVQNDHKQLAAWLELQQKCVYAYVYVMTQGTKDPFRVKATDTLIEPYASE